MSKSFLPAFALSLSMVLPSHGYVDQQDQYPGDLEGKTSIEEEIEQPLSPEVPGTSTTEDGARIEEGIEQPLYLEVHSRNSLDKFHCWPEISWTLNQGDDYELRIMKGSDIFEDWHVIESNEDAPAGIGISNDRNAYLLLPGQDYTFQLRIAGSTAINDMKEVTVICHQQQHEAPAPVSAKVVNGGVKLSWNDYTNGVAPYKYEYRIKEQGGSFGPWITVTDSFEDGTTDYVDGITILTHSTMIKGLESGVTYTVEMRSSLGDVFHDSYPGWSPDVEITAPDGPAGPEGLKAKGNEYYDGYHYVPTLQWSLGSNSEISGYDIRIKKGDEIFENWKFISINDLNSDSASHSTDILVDHLLEPSEDYTFEVRSVTPLIKGQISEVTVNHTPRQPLMPQPVSAKLVEGKNIKLSWADYTNGAAPYDYEYRIKKAGKEEEFSAWTEIEDSFEDGTDRATYRLVRGAYLLGLRTRLTHSAIIDDLELEPDTTYELEVRALLGSSLASYPPVNPASVTIPHQTPAGPAGFNASVDSSNHLVTLSWDDPLNKYITGYEYRMRTVNGPFSIPWTNWTSMSGSNAKTTSHTVQGKLRIVDGLYHFENEFQVRAVIDNLKGNSSVTWTCWLTEMSPGPYITPSNPHGAAPSYCYLTSRGY